MRDLERLLARITALLRLSYMLLLLLSVVISTQLLYSTDALRDKNHPSTAATCQSIPVWPRPLHCQLACNATAYVHPDTLSISVRSSSVKLNHKVMQVIEAAKQAAQVSMFLKIEHKQRGSIEPHLPGNRTSVCPADKSSLSLLDVELVFNGTKDAGNEFEKQFDSDESYEVSIDGDKATILARSVWGLQYGLRTLSQLVQYDSKTDSYAIHSTPLYIYDKPMYPWRGLMVDTANHFLPKQLLLDTLDVMATTKMNVLHWHMIGSYSFGLQLSVQPLLAQEGAWKFPEATYSVDDVQDVLAYAQLRGIRVVPEVDLPGHAYSWGLAYPDIVSSCPTDIPGSDIGSINYVPVDPTVPETYTVIESVLQEVLQTFSDRFLHIGGDEVQLSCWSSNPKIAKWMKDHNMTDPVQLQAYFESRLFELLKSISPQAAPQPIIWADTLAALGDMNPPVLPQSGLTVEVWNNLSLLEEALTRGYDVLLADGYYLDRQVPVPPNTSWFWQDTWAQMYQLVPSSLKLNASQAPGRGRIIGGEANMWSEQVSGLNFEARVWPRAFAIAERLWLPDGDAATAADISPDQLGATAERLAYHRCRVAYQGFAVGPIWADYCGADLPGTQPGGPKPNPNFFDSFITTDNLPSLFIFIVLVLACLYYYARSRNEQPKDSPRKPKTERTPLLAPAGPKTSTPSHSASSNSVRALPVAPAPRAASPRLQSLDVFRGLTVCFMVFVDNVGSSFPSVDHCPWNGIRLADFVMPSFDFIVGVSIALALKRYGSSAEGKSAAFHKATVRFLRLFVAGIATQGGLNFLEYDMAHIRIMGILQRVAVCYYVVALMEIYLPRGPHTPENSNTDATLTQTYTQYKWHWFCGVILMAAWTAIMYGVDVPPLPQYGLECGRGQLTPPCNAATYIDKMVLTYPHMYFPANGGDFDARAVTFRRLPECSGCSPGWCKPKPDQNPPQWCSDGPFDPEGVVSSLTAIVATVFGVHFGHVLLHVKDPWQRIRNWSSLSVFLIAVGLLMHYTFMPMNTDLYTISFLAVTSGASGLLLVVCYLFIDVWNVTWAFQPFRWMGMNAIAMYLGAEGGIIQWFLALFYWNHPDANLTNVLFPTGVYWGDSSSYADAPAEPSHNPAIMVWTLCYIAIWCIVAGYMFHHKIFVKV